MDPCELKDRLVVSAGELDVLCVVHLLQRAEEVGSVGMLVDTKHSWNGLTALTAAASDDFSPTRKLVLELLLLCLEDKDPSQTGSYKRLKKKSGEEWAVKLIEDWQSGAKEKAVDAQALLAVELPHVAAWVGTYLPKPLHPGAFTSLGPLPPRPPSPVPTGAMAPRPSDAPAPDPTRPLLSATSSTSATPLFSPPSTLPRCQVRLSSIPAILAPRILHQQITTLVTGLSEVQQKEPGTMLLSFVNEPLAKKAVADLKGPLHPIVVESLAPSHRQAPILRPPSSPPVASPPLSRPPRNPPSLSRTVRIHIGRLPARCGRGRKRKDERALAP